MSRELGSAVIGISDGCSAGLESGRLSVTMTVRIGAAGFVNGEGAFLTGLSCPAIATGGTVSCGVSANRETKEMFGG